MIRGLYAITPEEQDTVELLRKVRLALQGGARVLQYRNKLGEDALRLEQATALRGLTQEFGAMLIVNDDALLAQRVDADGVHLGFEDGSVAAARSLLSQHKIIGVSCYNQLSVAHEAVVAGADYVAFGAFFTSTVKPSAPVATLELLRLARRELSLPLVAIGGITLANGASVLAAGADAVAVISALFDAEDITRTAQQFVKLTY
ncbi:MAG: thiamine phosphate synthase [Gallionellales bacterium CG_4_8_14_3_um_filter_54_18]|nr:MAG: thiamine phosphate synthase [Gallionellales bacterium CG_4_8_14_3_um_filter_54_18]